ncbi:unnamed protein product [Moneuplotes crassus]|uniref:Uncharacterized protein n=1 Tax=Euplotes crassus TaxID=5936 RepID=A0AAD1Y2V1_EUPCR|nr:unnamed protein product [Moneuplotes crassus]
MEIEGNCGFHLGIKGAYVCLALPHCNECLPPVSVTRDSNVVRSCPATWAKLGSGFGCGIDYNVIWVCAISS